MMLCACRECLRVPVRVGACCGITQGSRAHIPMCLCAPRVPVGVSACDCACACLRVPVRVLIYY